MECIFSLPVQFLKGRRLGLGTILSDTLTYQLLLPHTDWEITHRRLMMTSLQSSTGLRQAGCDSRWHQGLLASPSTLGLEGVPEAFSGAPDILCGMLSNIRAWDCVFSASSHSRSTSNRNYSVATVSAFPIKHKGCQSARFLS